MGFGEIAFSSSGFKEYTIFSGVKIELYEWGVFDEKFDYIKIFREGSSWL